MKENKKADSQRDKTQISLRLLNQTLERVDKLAKKEHRSRSNMIDYLLQKALVGIGGD